MNNPPRSNVGQAGNHTVQTRKRLAGGHTPRADKFLYCGLASAPPRARPPYPRRRKAPPLNLGAAAGLPLRAYSLAPPQ